MESAPDQPFSLLTRCWIPAVRARGERVTIRPAELTDAIDTNPIVALDWPRPDLRVACLELLIGLLATACPPDPDDSEDWSRRWHEPPTTAQLDAAFAPLTSAFNLDGDGPRFCQDFEEIAGESLPVERLFIDSPGEQTVKQNRDLLVKRGRIDALGRAAAAMALYTLQAWAPSGGAGHRTSLRGGGPLVTLAMPGARHDREARPPLWHLLWANVPAGRPPDAADLPRVFPWLAPTRRSDAGGQGTALDGRDAHPLQVFWGMPRRIRLDFSQAQRDETCGLQSGHDPVAVRTYRTRPGGVQYINAAAQHPLSPTYRAKPADPERLAIHPQPDGIGYRHWHELTTQPSALRFPAATLTTFQRTERRGDIERRSRTEARLLAAGYDMDNMKARGFVEVEMPLLLLAGEGWLELALLARRLAAGATEAAGLLRGAVRNALDDPDIDSTPLDAVRKRFFDLTSSAFWDLLGKARDALDKDANAPTEDDVRNWLAVLRRHALALFDEAAPLDPLSPAAAGRLVGGAWRPPKIVEARRMLGVAMAGYGKSGTALFNSLELPLPETAAAKRPPRSAA